MKKRHLLSIPLLFLLPSLLGCADRCGRESRPRRQAWPVMGTVARIQCGAGSDADIAALRRTADAVFNETVREFSDWSPGSALSGVNRAAGGPAPVPVSQAFLGLLERSGAYCRASGGAFNPLIGPAVRAWGFNTAAGAPAARPSRKLLDGALALSDWRDVQIDRPARRVLLRKPGMRLDFGGIAKGYAVDRLWEAFRKAGADGTLIDLGGNLRCIGEAAPGRGGWRTAVRNPFDRQKQAAVFLLKPGEAVASSGNYERFVTIGGRRYAHILDGRTGEPVAGMAATTVVAPTAEQADALSTTLFILGIEEGAAYLARNAPECDALWIPDTPGKPAMTATPGMAARMLEHAEGWEVRVKRADGRFPPADQGKSPVAGGRQTDGK